MNGRLVLCGLIAAAGSAMGPAATAATRTVIIEGMQFSPAVLTVKSGDRVVWVNRDLMPHTATGQGFDSGAVAPGRSWQLTAGRPGRHEYVCTLHPTMKGVLVVQQQHGHR